MEHIHVLHYFRWSGLWHIWLTHKAFVFDGCTGIQNHIRRVYGILLWYMHIADNQPYIYMRVVLNSATCTYKEICIHTCLYVQHDS